MSDLVGEDIKTGPGDRSEIMYMFVVNSLLTCKGDADVTSDVTLSIYMAAQDGDMDGLPDEGEEPICIGPMDFESAQRRSKGEQRVCVNKGTASSLVLRPYSCILDSQCGTEGH